MVSLELHIKITPKEKALALRDKFTEIIDASEGIFINDIMAKECALISINEMLDFRNDLYTNENSLVHKHLLEIKKEIELL